jgi:hypothetical protein
MKLRTAVAALAALVASACVQILPAGAEQNVDVTGKVLLQASETSSAFNARFPGSKQNWDNISKAEINPILRNIASNFFGTSCAAIINPQPYQWCADATTRTLNLYTQPAGGGAFAWQPAFSVLADGSIYWPPIAGHLASADLSDSTAAGRAIFTAANAAAQRVALGYGSRTGGANQFQVGFDSAGLPFFAQPSFNNLSGSLACSQAPIFSGVITTSGASCSTSFSATALAGLNITASQIATAIIPSYIGAFTTTGYSAAGDGGAGCIYVAGSGGPGAITDALSRHFHLLAGPMQRAACYGAGLGAADDQAYIQAASTAASTATNGVGGSVGFTGSYTLGSGYVLPNSQVWDASAAGQAVFTYTPTTGSAVTLYGDASALRSAAITQSGTPTSTTGLQVGIGEQGQHTVARDVVVNGFTTGIDLQSNVGRKLDNVTVNASKTTGIRTRNTVNADSGDDTWNGVVVSNDPGVGEALVSFEGGGGLKVNGFKGLGGKLGFSVNMPDGAHTQDLMFGTSSIENSSIACMKFARSGTNGSFGLVTISNSEFAGCPTGNWFANGGVTSAFVGGNAYANVSSEAIRLDNGANNIVIGPNVYSTVTPIVDNRTDFSEDGYINRDTVHSFINIGTANTNVFEVAVPPFRAARIHVFIEGIAQGNDSFSYDATFTARRSGGNILLTAIGTPAATGAAIAVSADTTGSPGSVYFGISLPAGQGTSAAGTFTIKTEGKVKQITLH